MTFIYGGAAGDMGTDYKSHSLMHIIYIRISIYFMQNVQLCGLMSFIYGRAAPAAWAFLLTSRSSDGVPDKGFSLFGGDPSGVAQVNFVVQPLV